jgi:putative ABC transport system substrate-binding protein
MARPGAAPAQVPARQYRIGILAGGAAPTDADARLAALIRGLAERGYRFDRNLVFDRRGAETNMARLPELLIELIEAKADVIVTYGYPAAVAAKQGTRTVPVVVTGAGDPVETGLVDALARPGGNLTGFAEAAAELSAKRLEFLKLTVPNTVRVAMLWNADDLGMTLRYRSIAGAAQSLGIAVQALGVREPNDFDEAFDAMERQRPDALIMVADALTVLNRGRVIEFAVRHRLPSMFEFPQFVRDGGLISYGFDLSQVGERAASIIDRILQGANPATIPVEQPSRYVLAVNLKTAATLGLTIPPGILAGADEVIE